MSDHSSSYVPDRNKHKLHLADMGTLLKLSREKSWMQALRIASIYFLIGSLWIIMSDKIVGALISNQEAVVFISISKGWFYVLVTSAILFRLISIEINKVIDSRTRTELINTELENSNTLFSAILESSPEIMIFSIDNNYCYTAFNNRHKYLMLRLWGREIQIGDNVLEVIGLPEEAKKVQKNFDRALSGEYFTLVEEYSNDMTPKMDWQNHYSPIIAKDLSVIGLTCFVLNITAYKKEQDKTLYLSYHDMLTGLYNRRYYEEALHRIDSQENLPVSIIIGDLNGLKLVNDAFGHEVGDQLLISAADAISTSCRAEDIVARWGGDEFIILLPKTTIEQAKEVVAKAKSMSTQLNVHSVGVDISFGWSSKVDPAQEIRDVIKNAENLMYKNKTIESKSMQSNTVTTIMNTLHEKNPREEAHSKRVGELSRKIGIALHLSDYDVSTLNLIGFLHDIGKIAVEEVILNKPGKLTAPEFDEIKHHPEISCRIIKASNEIPEVADAVLYHHEKWDGSGYPEGLNGERIPKFARIICLADAFDAMTSDRTYRETWTTEKAAIEIRRCAGKQYDPEIAKVFVEDVLGCQWNKVS